MPEKRIVAVDSQKLDGMSACTYFYKNKFLDHLTSKVTPDYYEQGSLMHLMLECYYNLRRHKSRWFMNSRTHADVVNSCVIAGRHAAMKMNTPISETEIVIDSFIQYTDFYENDDWYDNKIQAVESTGSKILFDSEDLCILYEVKMDLIVSGRKAPEPVDHKTTKSRRDPNELANQFKGYCWFLGVNALTINEIGFQKTVAPKDKFRRHLIQYSQATLEEWRQNTIFWVRLTLGLIDAGQFPRNFTSCDKYSGCMFKELCAKDPEIRDYEISRLYDIKPWDVGQANL